MGGTIPLWRRAFRTRDHGRRKRCRVRCRGRRVCSASMAGAADAAAPALIHTDGDNLLHSRHRWNVPVRRTPLPSHVFGCLAGRAGFGPAKPSRATVAGCDVELGPLRTVRVDPPSRRGPAPWLTSPPAWLRTAGTSETHALVIGFADQARSFAWNQSVGLPPLTAEYATIPAGITLIALVTLVRRCWREGCAAWPGFGTRHHIRRAGGITGEERPQWHPARFPPGEPRWHVERTPGRQAKPVTALAGMPDDSSQGLRAMAPYMAMSESGTARWASESGRHLCIWTMPGSSRSRPSKKRSVCARSRQRSVSPCSW